MGDESDFQMTNEKPGELFPGLEWKQQQCGTAAQWTVLLWRGCHAQIAISQDGGVWADYDYEVDEFFSDVGSALDWLRDRIIEHRDALCRVTGGRFIEQMPECSSCKGGKERPYDGGPFGPCCTDCMNTGVVLR